MPINPASRHQDTNMLLRNIFCLVSLYVLWVNGKVLVVSRVHGTPCPAWVRILVIAPTMSMSLGGISPMATIQAPALLWGQAEAKGLVQLIPCPVLHPSVLLLSHSLNHEHPYFCLRLAFTDLAPEGCLSPFSLQLYVALLFSIPSSPA